MVLFKTASRVFAININPSVAIVLWAITQGIDYSSSVLNQHISPIREDAMLRYIEHAERLEMYGKIYSPVQNKKGDSLLFCVSHSGVSLCEEDKRKTLEKFDWCDIATLKNDGKQLSIKLQSGQVG